MLPTRREVDDPAARLLRADGAGPDGWADRPCSYLLFGPQYVELAAQARERGWRVAHLPGEHPHGLVDRQATAQHLLERVIGS